MSIRCAHDDGDSNYHVKLTNRAGEERGFIVVNTQGDPDVRMLRRLAGQARNIVATGGAQGAIDTRREPYSVVDEVDFSGGIGIEDFERNRTKFNEAGSIWTLTEGKVHPAPLYQMSRGYRNQDYDWPGSLRFEDIADATGYMAQKFTAGASYNVVDVWVILKYRGDPEDLTVRLRQDSSGSPGTVLQSLTVAATDMDSEWLSEIRVFTFPATAIVSGTDYWIEVVANTADGGNNVWSAGVKNGGLNCKKSSDGVTYSAHDKSLYFLVQDYPTANQRCKRWPFEYKRALYMVCSYDNDSLPKLFINGTRGVATGGGATTLADTGVSMVVNRYVGCVLYIYSSVGRGQARTILSNTATVFTVDEAWDTNPTANTEYVVLGSDRWTEITGHGLTGPITGPPLVSGEIIYFPQGDTPAIRRMRQLTVGGVWTTQFADDGTNKAVHLALARASDGTLQVWATRNSDANGNVSVSHGALKTWGTNLTLTAGRSPIRVGDNSSPITGLISYDSRLWVFKEDGLWVVQNEYPENLVPDMQYMRSTVNGAASGIMTPDLYYSFVLGVEQFFGKTQVDMGPNRGEGLPLNRQGYVPHIQPSNKYMFIAVNAGTTGYSSVMAGTGGTDSVWTEAWRAAYGERINALFFQSIPRLPARLWIFSDRLVGFQEYSETSFEPFQDSRIEWAYESYLVTGYMSDNLLDIDKYWGRLKLQTESLDPDVAFIEVDFQTDDDDTWRQCSVPFDTFPLQSVRIGDARVTGKRIRFRLRFYVRDSSVLPVLKALAAEYIARWPTSYRFTLPILLSNQAGETMEDLDNEPGDFTTAEIIDFLERAKDDPVPLLMNCVIESMDNLPVVLNPVPLQILDSSPGESSSLLAHLSLEEAP